MAASTRSCVTRRSIAHRAIASDIIDLTMDSPRASPTPVKPNDDAAFFCEYCFMETGLKKRLSIRNCLHQICIECARIVIIDCETVDVKCPIFDCDEYFQDRQIRALLSQVEYAQHVNQKTLALNNQNNNNELMELEEQSGFINCWYRFECGMCCSDIGVGDGMAIRECLHQFCIDCIRTTINIGEEAVVSCPQSGCESILQDREIRSLLTQEEFDKYSSKIMRIAESKPLNSFHCKKANCNGWVICEDDVIFFCCPICSLTNCLQCQAIHPNINCAEYQENSKLEGMNDDERSLYQC